MKKSLYILALSMILSVTCQSAIAENYYFRSKEIAIGTNNSADGIIVNSPSLSEGTTNKPYVIDVQPSANGGITPYVWSVTGDSELGINSSTGYLSGTPTSAGLKTITITATDSQGKKGTVTSQVQVYDVLNISGATFGTLSIGNDINVTKQPSATGGNGNYTWSLSSSPSWLSINSTNGHLTGKPTQNGTFNYTLIVNDTALHSLSKTFSGNIADAPSINIVNNDITTFTVGDIYNQQFAINANPAGMTYITGHLPDGTSLVANDTSATVNGTLTTAGKYDYQLNTTNVNGTAISDNLNVNVYDKLLLSSFSIEDTIVGDNYVVTTNPVATGGSGSYVYSILSQTTGTNLVINNSTGVLSGSPTSEGLKTVIIKAVDSNGREKTISGTITVYAALALNNPVFGNSTALAPVVITTQPSATGGNAPYIWSLSGNPSWMSINSSTGVISGTPNTVGDFSAKVIVISGTQTKTSAIISGTVQTPTLTLATTTLANKNTTDIISQDFKPLLTTIGVYDNNAIVWSAANLPTGLTINSSNGIVSGTVATEGTYNFVINSKFTVNGFDYTGTQNYSITIKGNTDISNINLGGYHSCALTTTGGVRCWGYNISGQLGNGTTTDSLISVQVSGLTSGVTNVFGGGYHSCALTTGGGLKCWGRNNYGQLGNGITTDSSIPVDVTGLTSGVASVILGYNHSCALTTSGGVKCWGYNNYGQLGNGNTTNSSIPVNVTGLTSGVASISGGTYHSCALTTTGGVKCWGYNPFGQLGNGNTTNSSVPVQVSGLTSGVASVFGGGYNLCALTTGGSLKCWGYNVYGQLGNGNTTNSSVPVQVSGLTSGVANVVGGLNHFCVLTTSGSVKCWGYNNYGQLGDGTTTNSSVPVQVSGLISGISNISNGVYHSCALATSGGVKCWGYNPFGQLGNGNTTNSSVPIQVSGLTSGMSIK